MGPRHESRTAVWPAVPVAALVLLAGGCSAPDEAVEQPLPESAVTLAPRSSGPSVFEDATLEAGLDFRHFNGMSGERYIVEMMGPGGALFDYDGDGDLDLWLRQGVMLGPDKTLADASFPLDDPDRLHDRLYRNDLRIRADGSGVVSFTDISDQVGIRVSDYGMGVAAADYDNDGHIDLYLTNFGPNRLLRNRGDGTFEDVTATSGTRDDRWSVPAVFFDFDRDGWLDLYVGNYINFSFANHKSCFAANLARDYCGPLSYRPEPDRLFRNRGDGSFEDVTATVGMAIDYGTALGVLAHDFTGDGWLDLFVANDAAENHLWINRGGEGFDEDGLLRGVAVNARGEREGSMGVSAGDFDADGDADLFITHMATETNTLYVNHGSGIFRDQTLVARLAAPSRPFTGFGTAWIDYDNDGWLDLFVVNGEVNVIGALERAGDPFPLHQRNQLFRNLGDGTFEEVSASAGPALELSAVGRGAVFGDIDNDGDTDVVIVNNNGPARLLLNRVGQNSHWLGLELRSAGRPVQGARVEIRRRAGEPLVRWAGSDGSYCSANDPRVLVGLGGAPAVDHVRVHWPSGRSERFEIESTDIYLSVVEGNGRSVAD